MKGTREDELPFKVRRMKLIAAGEQWRYKVCRYALSSLTGPSGVEADECEVIAATKHLIERWRARLPVLRASGWSAVQEAYMYVFAANCPPTGVLIDQMDLHPCNRRTICPFCWSRYYAMEAFHKFERVLYPVGQEGSALYDLIEVVSARRYPIAECCLEDALWFIKNRRADYYRKDLPRAKGGYILCSLEPPDFDSDNPSWLLTHRTLAIVAIDDLYTPKSEVITQTPQTVRTVKRIVQPTRRKLVGSIGRIAMYPTRLMTGPVEATVAILEACSPRGKPGCRMSGYYGKLHGKTKS